MKEGDIHTWTGDDSYLFNEGTHVRLWEKLGAHATSEGGTTGVRFGVWAPSAERVSVIGEFNDWEPDATPLEPMGQSGVWQAFVAEAEPGQTYKYHVRGPGDFRVDKADPFGFRHEEPPATGSIVTDLGYDWGDGTWMERRGADGRNDMDGPMSIYEVHLGSWRRDPERPDELLGYREIAPLLAEYVVETGFTHVELLPIMEHPFYGSWGYQTTGYFAPSSRYGSPQDFMYLVDHLHQNGIGVILDWVPSHFPGDEHGLVYFDGTHLYEHADPRQGFHPDWSSYIFNYGRHEVRAFLISSALFWLEVFHADGLRVDAVASMLYLDYSREAGDWIPNVHGGRENLEAIGFLRKLNEEAYGRHPDIETIAEESTAWPMVSRPTYLGGLGFGAKWDMGWMHDTLEYMKRDPVHRSYHHDEITFRMVYAFTESYVLPLSHDEVVHGKGSLLGRMPGDDWQRFANLRTLLGYMWAQPGKKLLFMGCEFGQPDEWNHDRSLPWHLLEEPRHGGVKQWVSDLNRLHREEPALHELDADPAGFEWVEGNDAARSTLAFLRRPKQGEPVLVVVNFTPAVHHNYRVGLPQGGEWQELLNSDATVYGGSGQGNMGVIESAPVPYHGRPHSLSMTLPPLAVLFLKRRP